MKATNFDTATPTLAPAPRVRRAVPPRCSSRAPGPRRPGAATDAVATPGAAGYGQCVARRQVVAAELVHDRCCPSSASTRRYRPTGDVPLRRRYGHRRRAVKCCTARGGGTRDDRRRPAPAPPARTARRRSCYVRPSRRTLSEDVITSTPRPVDIGVGTPAGTYTASPGCEQQRLQQHGDGDARDRCRIGRDAVHAATATSLGSGGPERRRPLRAGADHRVWADQQPCGAGMSPAAQRIQNLGVRAASRPAPGGQRPPERQSTRQVNGCTANAASPVFSTGSSQQPAGGWIVRHRRSAGSSGGPAATAGWRRRGSWSAAGLAAAPFVHEGPPGMLAQRRRGGGVAAEPQLRVWRPVRGSPPSACRPRHPSRSRAARRAGRRVPSRDPRPGFASSTSITGSPSMTGKRRHIRCRPGCRPVGRMRSGA